MGQRSSTATIADIVCAFLEKRTWTQAALAKRVELSTAAIRKRLEELQASGIPLERQEDHPHVYWSVPKDWFPGAVVFKDADVTDLLRLLARLPRSKSRDRFLQSILDQLPARHDIQALGRAAIAPPDVPLDDGPADDRYQALLEDAAATKQVIKMRYFTASRGSDEWRHVSVHRVVAGPPVRFIATCHRSGTLKWFRVDNVFTATHDPSATFRPAEDKALVAFAAESLDGFHQDGPAVAVSFFVRDPESRWVSKNLLPAMRFERTRGGIRVSVATTAILRVASYVAGLGEAARPETACLAQCVVELAEGALRSARAREASGG